MDALAVEPAHLVVAAGPASGANLALPDLQTGPRIKNRRFTSASQSMPSCHGTVGGFAYFSRRAGGAIGGGGGG
eukprot:354461-Chlamydomonas_euryale.AAC.12